MELKNKIALIRAKHIAKCEQEALKAARKLPRARGFNRYCLSTDIDSALDNMQRDPLGVSYRPRLGIFKEHRVDFDATTGLGHSYDWYEIAKRIDGVQVLNTYNYSQQTAQHVSMLQTLFKQLGIRYIEIEAPLGLQDLDSARKHILYAIAKQAVAAKYARDGGSRYVGAKHSTPVASLRKQLKALSRFNFAPTASMMRDAMELAESERRWKLDRLADRRRERKAMAALIIEIDAENKRASESALHIIKPHAWSWDGDKFTGRVEEYERRQAIAKGFTRIIVHREAPRALSLVAGGAQ